MDVDRVLFKGVVKKHPNFTSRFTRLLPQHHGSVEHVYLQDEHPSKLRYLSFFGTGKNDDGSSRLSSCRLTYRNGFFCCWYFWSLLSLFLCEDPQEESMKDPWICTDWKDGWEGCVLEWYQGRYLEEHPRTCKWLGSSPYYKPWTAVWKGEQPDR